MYSVLLSIVSHCYIRQVMYSCTSRAPRLRHFSTWGNVSHGDALCMEQWIPHIMVIPNAQGGSHRGCMRAHMEGAIFDQQSAGKSAGAGRLRCTQLTGAAVHALHLCAHQLGAGEAQDGAAHPCIQQQSAGKSAGAGRLQYTQSSNMHDARCHLGRLCIAPVTCAECWQGE